MGLLVMLYIVSKTILL